MDNLKTQLDKYLWIRRTLLAGIPLNCNEIADRLDCTAKTVQRYINKMRRDGHRVEYVPRLRGYIIAAPLPPADDRTHLIRIIRAAHTWTRLQHPSKTPAWLTEAENILKPQEE